MEKLDILYDDKKKKIYSYYLEYNNIDADNIFDVNDLIIDQKIKKEELDIEVLEFYITLSMCAYMVDHDLYDEYFFKTYLELLDCYNSEEFDNLFKDILLDKQSIDNDIDSINDYLKKDEIKMKYYQDVSDIYNDEFHKFEDEVDNFEE